MKVFRHNDPDSLAAVLRDAIREGRPRTGVNWKKIIVIVEGIYSMEGEICRLKEISAVCKKFKVTFRHEIKLSPAIPSFDANKHHPHTYK